MYQNHIEGKVDPTTRTAGRHDENNPKPLDDSREEDEIAQEDSKQERPKSNSRSGLGSAHSSVRGDQDKYHLPETCKLQMLKANRVEDLGMNYNIVQHPFPQIDGELLIFQSNLEDKADSDKVMVYRDYSLRKRIPPSNKKYQSAASKKKQLEDDTTRTKI